MRPSTKVVATGLFLVVEVPQDMEITPTILDVFDL